MSEITAHDPETGDHDRPKWLIGLRRNQCSRWREIRTRNTQFTRNTQRLDGAGNQFPLKR
jgi:hypothetical protein